MKEINRRTALGMIGVSPLLTVGCGPEETKDENAGGAGTGTDGAGTDTNGGAQVQLNEEKATSWIAELTKAGWPKAGANAVVRLNHGFYQMVEEDTPKKFETVFTSLKNLGSSGDRARDIRTHDALEKCPHAAGLLAKAAEKHPKSLSDLSGLLGDIEIRDSVLALLTVHTDVSEWPTLLRVIKETGKIIPTLYQLGVMEFPQWIGELPKSESEEERVFFKWLNENMQAAIDNGDDEIARINFLLTQHSAVVSRLLSDSESFQKKFLSSYWPKFKSRLDEYSDHNDDAHAMILLQNPQVWKIFDEFGLSGFEAFCNTGTVAVNVLLGEEFEVLRASPEHKSRLVGFLNASNEQALWVITDFQHLQDDNFTALFERTGLTPRDLVRALEVLYGEDRGKGDSSKTLRRWRSASDKNIKSELEGNPEGVVTWLPGFSVYLVASKAIKGHPVSGMDVLFAALDAGEVFVGLKGSGKLLKTIGKKASKQIQKGIAKKVGKEGVEKIAESSSRNYASWVFRETRDKVKATLKVLDDKLSCEITPVIEFAFKNGPFSNKTFKKLAGVDARIFMRKDRTLLVRPGRVLNSKIGRMIQLTALNAGIDKGGEKVLETVQKGREYHLLRTEDREQAAQQNISVWLTAMAFDLFDANDKEKS